MTNEQKTFTLLAKATRAQTFAGSGQASAQLLIVEAYIAYNAGDLLGAVRKAIRSMHYSVGKFSSLLEEFEAFAAELAAVAAGTVAVDGIW